MPPDELVSAGSMLNSTRREGRRALTSITLFPSRIHIPHAESSRSASLRAAANSHWVRHTSTATSLRKGKSPVGNLDIWHNRRQSSSAFALETDEQDDSEDGWRWRHSLEELDEPPLTDQRPSVPLHRHYRPPDSSFPQPTAIAVIPIAPPLPTRNRPPDIEITPPISLPPIPFGTSPSFGIARSPAQEILELIETDPLQAFRKINTKNSKAADSLLPKDLDRLFDKINAYHARNYRMARHFTKEDTDCALQWMITATPGMRRPTFSVDPPGPQQSLRTQRGLKLSDFARYCIWFRRPNFVKPIFNKLVQPLIDKGFDFVHSINNLSRTLKNDRHWTLLVDLFAHPRYPAEELNLPIRHWTPDVLSNVFMAYLELSTPSAVPHLFNRYVQYHPAPIKAITYCQLSQAFLELGRVEEAAKARWVEERSRPTMHYDQFIDYEHRLAGQLALGFDPNLEQRVCDFLDDLPPSSVRDPLVMNHVGNIVSRLVRLRLDVDDIEGAKTLLKRFEIDDGETFQTIHPPRLPPCDQIISAAFATYTHHPETENQVRWWWYVVRTKMEIISDRDVSILIRALCRLDMTENAFRMVERSLREESTDAHHGEGRFAFLDGIPHQIDSLTMNVLLEQMARRDGEIGLTRVMRLMDAEKIQLDEMSLAIILNAMRSKSKKARPLDTVPPKRKKPQFLDATDLINLLENSLRRMTTMSPSIKHLDAIMLDAVRSVSLDQTHFMLNPAGDGHLDFDDPAAGLKPIGEFARAIQPLIDDLRQRGVPARSASVANRLQVEAASGAHVQGVSTAKMIFNQFVARGYKPTSLHFTALIKGYSASGNLEYGRQILDVARTSGVMIDRPILHTLMMCHGNAGDVKRAEGYFRDIQELETKHGRRNQGVDQAVLTSMVQIYRKAEDRAELRRFLSYDLRLDEGGYDDKLLTVLGGAYGWLAEYATAVRLIDEHTSTRGLNDHLRDLLRSLRVHLERKVEQYRATQEDQDALARCREMIINDKVTRLGARPGSGSSKSSAYRKESDEGDLSTYFSELNLENPLALEWRDKTLRAHAARQEIVEKNRSRREKGIWLPSQVRKKIEGAEVGHRMGE